MSAPHIYHSALILSPSTSIIRGLYGQHATPLARIVRGLSLSWEPAVATAYLGPQRFEKSPMGVWSPCSKFIAANMWESVEVLDAVTLSRLAAFKHTLDHPHFSFSPDSRSLAVFTSSELISWDIQTGGRLSEIHGESLNECVRSFTYSKDGKMVAVAYESWDDSSCDVCTFDLPSRTQLGPLPVPDGKFVCPIWAHDEYLRFATIHPGSLTIWEVEFTLKHPPTKVESFPIPDEVFDGDEFQFLPALYRLAFTLKGTIRIQDVKASEFLLWSKASDSLHSFSPDGRFFASLTIGGGARIWKESPAGYALHQKIPSLVAVPFFSPNGRSIIFHLGRTINLRHTGNQTLSPPRASTEEHGPQNHFLLAFSPNEKLAAFAQLDGNVVTVLDLRSGDLRLTIDTGTTVKGLGVAGNTAAVVDGGKAVTWNLHSGDRAFNASINNRARAVMLDRPLAIPGYGTCLSLSPDLSRVAIYEQIIGHQALEIYNVTTGTCLASTSTFWSATPKFTQYGREVWIGDRGWGIIEGGVSGAGELKRLEETLYPSRTFLWDSIRGYKVTEDGWVLSPSRKRLLWLPHRWRSDEEDRLWSGRFLGLSHGLSEPVILEFLE